MPKDQAINFGKGVRDVKSNPNMGQPGGTFGKGLGTSGPNPVGYNPNGTKAGIPSLGPAPAPHRKA